MSKRKGKVRRWAIYCLTMIGRKALRIHRWARSERKSLSRSIAKATAEHSGFEASFPEDERNEPKD